MIKTSLKAMCAAVALACASTGALANIQPGTTTQGATGSELVFYAFDDITKTSFVMDLGVTYSAFLASPTTAYNGTLNNVGGDANWALYKASVGDNLSNTKWGVFGTMKTSALSANGVNILTTARNNAPANTQTGLVRGIDGSFNSTFLGGLQGTASNYGPDLTYFTQGATNVGNWAASMQHNLAGKVSFLADNTIGTAANFYRLSAAASATANATLATVLSPATEQWRFDGSTLTVAPVPEPETYGMLLAGLAIVGAVARRRKSA